MHSTTNGNTSYTRQWLLRQQIIRLARQHGLNGSLFSEDPAPLGTLSQENLAISLYCDLQPRPKTAREKYLAKVWTHNVVMSSSAVSPSTTRKMAKERRRVASC